MKKKKTIIYENFEKISESQENNLVGGFSTSFSNQAQVRFDIDTNNCKINCIPACRPENSGCNTIASCGPGPGKE